MVRHRQKQPTRVHHKHQVHHNHPAHHKHSVVKSKHQNKYKDYKLSET